MQLLTAFVVQSFVRNPFRLPPQTQLSGVGPPFVLKLVIEYV